MTEPVLPGDRPAFSEARAKRLKLALWLTMAIGLIMAAGGIFLQVSTLGISDDQQSRFRQVVAFFLLLPAAVLLLAATVSLRLLPRRSRGAKTAAVVTGAVTALASIPLSQGFVGLPLTILGVVTMMIATFPERPAR